MASGQLEPSIKILPVLIDGKTEAREETRSPPLLENLTVGSRSCSLTLADSLPTAPSPGRVGCVGMMEKQE